jgi:hypothetical protein
LLVVDNHPDWMRRVPLLHCGTWLNHAARLPHVCRVFHVGGEVDFDNAFRWLAPWSLLRDGKVVVFPAFRRFVAGWSGVPNVPLRPVPDVAASPQCIAALLAPWRDELAARPLYVSLDRDVLKAEHATVNWDSGHLTVQEVLDVLTGFLDTSGALVGMDVVGDWSEVKVEGTFRRFLHYTEHPRLEVDGERATALNEALNLTLVELVRRRLGLIGQAEQARAA